MNLQTKLMRVFLLILLMGAFTMPSFAQIENIGAILQSSKEDANKLTKAYLKPYGAGFGAGLNTGWTNTAKTHHTLGFDITVSSGLAIVPDGDLSFNINDLNLQELQIKNGPPTTPTASGISEPGPTMAAYANVDQDPEEEELFNFEMPEGTDFGYVPAPMLKAGVGLIKNTDLMLRFTPKYDIPKVGGTVQLFGVGVKHDIKQWLPGSKLIPVDISLMYGFSSMEINKGFRLDAEDVINGRNGIKNDYPSSTWDDQKITLKTNGWTINALVGKTLPVISVYGGIGYEASTLSVRTPGSYPTVKRNDTGGNEPMRIDVMKEPIDLEIDGKNGFRALAGFRFRFAIFHISGSYTLANYSSYNLGVGISFR